MTIFENLQTLVPPQKTSLFVISLPIESRLSIYFGYAEMASFQKRSTGWRVEIQVKGHRECRAFDTKAQGQTWAVLRETELRQTAQSGVIAGKIVLDTLHRYAREISPTKRGHR